ncbi:MAG: hypothetical protein DLM57_01580 [Pseudonocardiales bacterium]|nr:MAG: hypothetical protein DLM57_01580 [Pseudonocardiales bacterium]
MRVRKLSTVLAVTAALAVAAGGLAGCNTKVGQAAIVDGHRISESDLVSYVSRSGPSPSVLVAASKAGRGVYPKSQVVEILVQQQLFEAALAKNGGVPGSGELATLHDRAAAMFLGTQLTGAQLDSVLAASLNSSGFAAKFARTLLRTVELETALVVKTKAQSLAQLTGTLDKLHLAVQVNPRYGKWDPKTLSLGGPDANVPDFLKLGGVAVASQSAAAPTS